MTEQGGTGGGSAYPVLTSHPALASFEGVDHKQWRRLHCTETSAGFSFQLLGSLNSLGWFPFPPSLPLSC